jgi:antitoxin component YwqK of YwqJK toxin-antitoxin module
MLSRPTYFILLLHLLSCGDDGAIDVVSNLDKSSQSVDFTPEQVKEYAPGVQIRERINKYVKEKILKEFDKHLNEYPMLEHTMAIYRQDGLLYPKGATSPFSGRIIHLNETGNSIHEAFFLDGQPHGKQIRKNNEGMVVMEAWMDRGVLSGVKTKWWRNGQVNEEEYWEEGSYRGRSVWDESGRLIKQEHTR